ncbi:hypothetical protein J3E69DRAFT_133352 [Trichoderma sp. SZMC 28015]
MQATEKKQSRSYGNTASTLILLQSYLTFFSSSHEFFTLTTPFPNSDMLNLYVHIISPHTTSPANFAKGSSERPILDNPVLVYSPTEHSNGNVSQLRKSGMQESTNPPNSATSTPVSHLDAVSPSFWRPKLWSNRETYTHMSREICSLVSGILLPKLTSDLFVSTHIPDVHLPRDPS